MKNIIAIFILSMFIGLSNVSADTWTGNVNPVAVADEETTEKWVSVTIDVLENDTDTNTWDLLEVIWTSDLTNGTASFTSTGVTFTPNEWFIWLENFKYTISDWNEWTATWDIEITVIEHINIAPIAEGDEETTEEWVSVTIDVLENDTDEESDDLEVTWTSNVTNGTASFTSTWVTFTPNESFVWTEIFNYTISDWNGWTATWDIEVTVEAVYHVNTAPVAVFDEETTDEWVSVTVDVLDNDTDIDWDDLEITLVSNELNGTTSITSTWILFTPNDWFVWIATFDYTVSDGNDWTDVWHVEVTVEEVDEGDDDNDDDNENNVKEIQKEFIKKFKELKANYKGRARSSREYKNKKADLFATYKSRLQWKTYSYSKKSKKSNNKWRGNSKRKNVNYEEYSNNTDDVKAKYKRSYKRKYGKMISKLSDSKITILLGKIDDLIEKVNDSDSYSDDTKEKFTAMLEALREIVTDTEPELNIDWLFE